MLTRSGTADLQKIYIRHWIARGVCLIALPLSIYMFCFKLHFLILNRSGPGDSQMSSLFQAHLHGNDFANNPLGAYNLSQGVSGHADDQIRLLC